MVEKPKTYRYNEVRANGGDRSGEINKILQLNESKANTTNTIAYVQILGTGMDTHDTLPSILLFFDKHRFIFNAGEGLQRFCAEHKIKLSKIDHICLSRVCSETAGGLPGLLLTLASIGEGMSVNIWGPSNLELLIKAMKSFIPHVAMVHTNLISDVDNDRTRNSDLAPCSSSATPPAISQSSEPIVLVKNKVVKISAVLLKPSCSERSDVRPSDISVIYICELPEVMGKFNAEKADALGLKDKTKYSKLQKNESVESDCLDIMVHPSDVMGPPIPGPIVIIVDCPTMSHAEELLSIQSLNDYYSDFLGNKAVNCIIHLTPASVVHCPSYEKWMRKFGSTQHIIAGHSMKNVEIPILKSSAMMGARLNYLCPKFFPTPAFCTLQQQASSTVVSTEGIVSDLSESISAENLLKFTLRPHSHFGLDRSNVPSVMVPSEFINELLSEIPEIADAAQHISKFGLTPGEMKGSTTDMQDDTVRSEKQLLDRNSLPCSLENIRRDDLEIVLLGTGSSQPSKYRNVTSIYINLFSKGSLLLDCGEGTLAQLRRRFGIEGANEAVRNLKCIWISHIHADHHAGIARILALRQDLLKGVSHQKLLVIGPSMLQQFLDEYQTLEDLDMEFLDCRNTTIDSWHDLECDIESIRDQPVSESPINAEDINGRNAGCVQSTSFTDESFLQRCPKKMRVSNPVENEIPLLLNKLKKVLHEAGLERLISFPVVHCPESYGVVLKAAERMNSAGKIIPGWKIVYSGDTRPCPELIEASQGATILIHEATFEDCMEREAIAKNHCTTKEAIEVGESAGAHYIILTHFSQRYPKIPALDEIGLKKTCIAFDLMSINIADLPLLPNILPYLKLLFRKDMVVD